VSGPEEPVAEIDMSVKAKRSRDKERTKDINDLVTLLETFYLGNKNYPAGAAVSAEDKSQGKFLDLYKLFADQDPETYIDPFGRFINADSGSDYKYAPSNCMDGECENYTLTSSLEAVDYIYTKKNLN